MSALSRMALRALAPARFAVASTTRSAAAPAPSTASAATRSIHWLKHDNKGRKTNKYKTMLKAKRRRQRRGHVGGPPRANATFRTYVGFQKKITFLPNRLGFHAQHLKDDPSLVVPINNA
ncbi:hypothetical protein GGF31_004611 [Allomyces arbusculus]|nr:hypothetical protein GGF31_004611 [Allomyces arbusculus]